MGHHEADGSQNLRADGERLDAAALERGRWLFAQACAFTAGSDRIDSLPEGRLPEVAFAGRSNVGKSSLLNALVGRKALARVSRTPGRTQAVNLFSLGGRIVLADLPGFGWAKASKSRIEAWSELVEAYLRGRARLSRVFLLVDCRVGVKDSDRHAMRLLDAAAVSYQLTLTKCDDLARDAVAETAARLSVELAAHAAAHPAIVATSARTGLGIDELRGRIAALADWPLAAD